MGIQWAQSIHPPPVIMVDVPSYDEFMEPTWRILKKKGSATLDELTVIVAEDMGLSQEQTTVLHNEGPRTEYDYRMAWARTYLKQSGISENPSRGLWVNTTKGNQMDKIDIDQIKSVVNEYQRNKRAAKTRVEITEEENTDLATPEIDDPDSWMDILIKHLLEVSPTGFEKLCERLLRQVGFEEVVVTKRSGDGGIDGTGKLRTMDLFTTPVAFQSKRYAPHNKIGSPVVREFRGALDGRTQMGVIITTSSYSRDAVKEAERDGAFQINLINGIELCELLKQYRLGVSTESSEIVSIEPEFFKSLE